MDSSARTKLSFTFLVWIFLIMSVVGLLGESIVSFFQDGFWKNRVGLLWGPFSPIYGVGTVLLTLVLHPLQRAPLPAVFVAAGAAGAAFEWLASWFFENAFGIVAWSYTNHPFNFEGRTSLVMAAIWGMLGVAWIKVALPFFTQLIGRIPQRTRTIGAAMLCAFFILDALATLGAFNCWFERLSGRPVETPLQQFFATHYGNDFMTERFQTMSLWTDLAKR